MQIEFADEPQPGRARSSLAERVRLLDDLAQAGKVCEKDDLWFDEDKHKVLQPGRNH